MKDRQITQEEHELIPRALTHEINLLYNIVTALDAMVFDIERRFKAVNASFHFERDSKRALTRYFDLLKQCQSQYENFIEPSIIKVSQSTQFKAYEDSRILGQEFIRLLMLYYTKCSTYANHEKVFDFISSLEGGNGIFTAEDINRFNLGCNE